MQELHKLQTTTKEQSKTKSATGDKRVGQGRTDGKLE